MAAGQGKENRIVNVLRKYIKESKKVRFEEMATLTMWAAEAEKRGLSQSENLLSSI